MQVTSGAGRVETAIFSPDSSHIVYTANYSPDKPITTHQDVWITAFEVRMFLRWRWSGGKVAKGFSRSWVRIRRVVFEPHAYGALVKCACAQHQPGKSQYSIPCTVRAHTNTHTRVLPQAGSGPGRKLTPGGTRYERFGFVNNDPDRIWLHWLSGTERKLMIIDSKVWGNA